MLQRPPPLSPGAPIAVVAPASAPRSHLPYDEGLSRLRETYDVRTAWSPGAERGYLSAPDSDRIAALVEYFSDYAEYLVVALLPEDAQALDGDYTHISDI